jgi:predicted  nucleic acid-binding Zn-ribbon protein
MSEDVDSLVLRYLRRIDEKVDRLAADVADLKVRMTLVEQQLAGMAGQYAGLSARIDRIELRLERIERRLDLAETPR